MDVPRCVLMTFECKKNGNVVKFHDSRVLEVGKTYTISVKEDCVNVRENCDERPEEN